MSNNINEKVEVLERRSWDRSHEVVVSNIYNKTPVLLFKLQKAKLTGTEFTASDSGTLQVQFSPSTTYGLLNPIDDSVVTDEMFIAMPRHYQIQILLYSEYKNALANPLAQRP